MTVKRNGDRVILKGGRVSCSCCCPLNPFDLSSYPETTKEEYRQWLKGGIADISMSYNGIAGSYSDSFELTVPPQSCEVVEWSSIEPECYWDDLGITFFRGVSMSFGIIATVDWGYRVVAYGSGFYPITISGGSGNECVNDARSFWQFDGGYGVAVTVFGKDFYYAESDGPSLLSVTFDYTPNA